MSELQLAMVRLKDDIFGVDSAEVKQIIKYQDVKKVQDMPDYVDGVVTLRGEDIPVISLSRKLALGETRATKKAKILLTEINEHLLGFAVDDVTKLVKYAEGEIGPIPDIIRKSGNSCIKSVGRKGESMISILDLKSVITGDEAVKLKMKSGT